jgi:Zn-dependent protease
MSDEILPAELVDPHEDASAALGTDPAQAHRPQVGQFYRVDSSRASFRELWRDTRSPVVLAAWLIKLLRVKMEGSINDPNVVSLRTFSVADSAVSAVVGKTTLQKFGPVVRELQALGFDRPVFFAIDDRFHHTRLHQVAMLHHDGRTVARVTHRAEGMNYTKLHFHTEFFTELESGEFLHASSARAQTNQPPRCRLVWKYGAAASQLWIIHRQALDEASESGQRVVAVRDRAQVIDLLERHHELIRDFNIARGVFKALRGGELTKAEAIDSVHSPAAALSGYAGVLGELRRLEKKHTNWVSTLLVLAVSLGVFIGASARDQSSSGELLGLIVAILLVHEAGHFLAMKLFNYRNVRMFFIPLFGAAVSGQNYSAPGWKKVIVALMGPLPGIFLGGVLGLVGILKHNDAMMKVAMMAILINGFQLLPILPLDGGRVMHALLFSRHYFLDVVFQVVAAGALAAIGGATNDKWLLYLGVAMLVSVPATYKTAKIAADLRRARRVIPVDEPEVTTYAAPPGTRPIPVAVAAPPATLNTSPANLHAETEGEEIPEPIAVEIIDRVRASFRRLQSPRQIAQLTLKVYENLASRPPGIGASIGFAGLHLASFVAALALLVVVAVPQAGLLTRMAMGVGYDATHPISPDTIATWEGESVDSLLSPTLPVGTNGDEMDSPALESLVATMSTVDEARALFAEVTRETPPTASAACFGPAVLLTLGTSDTGALGAWLDRIEAKTKDVFIADSSAGGVSARFTCVAPDSARATQISEKLATYLRLTREMYAIPPWAGDELDTRPPHVRAQHETACALYARLEEPRDCDSPELEQLNQDLQRELRRNNKAEIKRVRNEYQQRQHECEIRQLEKIRDEQTSAEERELVTRYIKLSDARYADYMEDTNAAETDDEQDYLARARQLEALQRDEIGPVLGQFPLDPATRRPAPPMQRSTAHSGYAEHNGTKVTVDLQFYSIVDGAPQLVRWLAGQGCTDLKFDFQRGFNDYD